MKELNDRYQNSLLPKSKKLNKATGPVGGNQKGGKGAQYIKFDEIKESLTGYARIIKYKSSNSNNDAAHNEIDSMEEGHFVKGLKDGYCRSISAIDGSAAVGYHKEGLPNGKWCYYKYNGDVT